MRNPSLINRKHRMLVGVVFATVLGLLPACGSSDKKGPLVQVAAPTTGYPTASTVRVKVTPDSGQPIEKDFTAAEASTANLGVFLPSGTTGNVTITVTVLDANNTIIAQGTTPVFSLSGDLSKPIQVVLSPVTPITPDVDGGSDGGGLDLGTVVDTLSDTTDTVTGGDANSDVFIAPDLSVQEDGKADTALPPADVGPDRPEDKPSPPDQAPDMGPDLGVDVSSTINVFANCTPYTHTKIDSTGKPYDFGIRGLSFTPDGKYLISFGEDSRAKVWKVTAAGLQDAVTGGMIISGDRSLFGAISPNGKYVAIGDWGNNLSLYDLESSIQLGSIVTAAQFPASVLSKPDGVERVQFTTDGNHLVVVYDGDGMYVNNPDPNQLVVWDIATQKVVRTVYFDNNDHVRTILPADYSQSMWVVSAKQTTLDGGTEQYTVSVQDVATAEPRSIVHFDVPTEVSEVKFWPDAQTLAIGLYDGEVGLWDITNKSNITRLGSPIIGSTSDNEVWSFASTKDNKYLAVGMAAFMGSASVKLYSLQSKTALQKNIDYGPWSLEFAPDGLSLAIGGGSSGAIIYCKP
jgi:WD40 repeat protein